VFLGLSGCTLFGKKGGGTPAARASADPLLPQPDSSERKAAADPGSGVVPASTTSGILAGQVIDSYSRPVADAYILVSFPKKPGQKEKKPIDMPGNSRGYFTITGLDPGASYQLTARARDGRRMMAGITWATPPNPRVLIRISEDFVSKNTPPIPPPPVWPWSKDKGDKAAAAQGDKPKTTAGDKPERDTARVQEGWVPRGIVVQPKPEPEDSENRGSPREQPVVTQPRVQVAPERVADRNTKRNSDLAEWKGGPVRPQSRPRSTPSSPEPASRVPSCVLVGKQLSNFALYDLDAKPWEFRQRTGKVVLLDFWGTWCVPCRQAIPNLKVWQDRYRKAGLQVIGIAYETQGTAAQQRRKVDDFCQKWQINYKVLMGSADCPVRSQFDVRAFPTLILLDENGWILERHVGYLKDDDWLDLERRIRRWLGVP
jgi:thiol-disulfide isomerase/thioredoxin